MAQAGKGAGRQQQQGLQESVLHSVIHPLHPSSRLQVAQAGSPCSSCSHAVARHSPLELRLLEPPAAGMAAGDQVGSSEAGWM